MVCIYPTLTADVVFPRFPVADKEDSEKADAETSEELFD